MHMEMILDKSMLIILREVVALGVFNILVYPFRNW